MIERLSPPGVPAPRGPYSPAVRAGDFIFVSGQVAVDAAGHQAAEVRQFLPPPAVAHARVLVEHQLGRGAVQADDEEPRF